jgi:hypothetical protein
MCLRRKLHWSRAIFPGGQIGNTHDYLIVSELAKTGVFEMGAFYAHLVVCVSPKNTFLSGCHGEGQTWAMSWRKAHFLMQVSVHFLFKKY